MFVLSPSATHVSRSGTAFSARKRVSTNTPPPPFLSWTDPMNNWKGENSEYRKRDSNELAISRSYASLPFSTKGRIRRARALTDRNFWRQVDYSPTDRPLSSAQPALS